MNYDVEAKKGSFLIKSWTRGVAVEEVARQQLRNLAALPFIYKHVAVMPDVHYGIGATVGSVIPTKNVIIPAAVGVDLGCGMHAVQLQLRADQLPDSLAEVRTAIEAAVPHGRTAHGETGDKGAWGAAVPTLVNVAWHHLAGRFEKISEKHPKVARGKTVQHLGTLGGGNHFIELCIDEGDTVWVMLHSGSRGVGGRIGNYFISKAKEEMRRWHIDLVDQDLAYLPQGSQYFDDYMEALNWAQEFAHLNRKIMMRRVLFALRHLRLPGVYPVEEAIDCHHNYVSREHHFGENIWVTRKGAVRARKKDLGIIPGSMGARSFIVRGKGEEMSFHSCSHGAGRIMSRNQARKQFTVEDHMAATAGIECRKDEEVIDETPGAYKSIDDVMAAQADLVDIVHTLKQVVCVKG